MIKFEKVSFEQFCKDCNDINVSYEELRELYDKIELPKRSTSGSAGYDFKTPFNIKINDSSTSVVPSGIRVIMPKDVVLLIVPRSGSGFKYGVALANTVGVIDSDYYFSNNEGHIMFKFKKGFANTEFCIGDKIAQGIFVNYLTADDDNVKEERNGGFGSTGR